MKRVDRLRHVGIGMKLYEARKGSNFTTRTVAERLNTSPASISRTENHQRLPKQDEVVALCALYGLGKGDKEKLLAQLNEADDTESWLAHGDVPDELASLMELERQAKTIIDAPTSLVPGLAQTPEYARQVLALTSEGEELERRVRTRITRQTILSQPRAPKVTFFVDEAALARRLGGAGVMRRQLEHLLTLQNQRNVSIRILPLREAETSACVPFTVHELGPDTYVFVEAVTLGVFITENAGVQRFVKICRGMDMAALDEETSSELIARTAKGYGDEQSEMVHE